MGEAIPNVNTRLVVARALLEGVPEERRDDDGDAFDLAAVIAELSALPDVGCPHCGGRIFSHLLPEPGPMSRAPPGGPPS